MNLYVKEPAHYEQALLLLVAGLLVLVLVLAVLLILSILFALLVLALLIHSVLLVLIVHLVLLHRSHSLGLVVTTPSHNLFYPQKDK